MKVNKNKINYIIIFSMLTLFEQLQGVGLTITKPGLYTLGDDLTIPPVAADSIILIASSDVTLDLGGRIISQSSITGGGNGISIQTGLTNITIKNGTIRNITSNGIAVASGCKRITIENIVFQDFSASPISLSSSCIDTVISNCTFRTQAFTSSASSIITIGSTCSNLFVDGCSFKNLNVTVSLNVIDCSVASTQNLVFTNLEFTTISGVNTNLFNLANSNAIYISNIVIEAANSTGAMNVINASTVSGLTVDDVTILKSSGGTTFSALNLSSVNGANVSNIVGASNTATTNFTFANMVNSNSINFSGLRETNSTAGGVFSGVVLSNSSKNTFKNCVFNGNTGEDTFLGWDIISSSSYNYLTDCQLVQNTSVNTCRGFTVAGSASSFNTFDNCVATGLKSTAVNTVGFQAQSTTAGTQCHMRYCLAYNNSAPGVCIGLGVDVAGVNWSVVECNFFGNTGTTNSFGASFTGTSGIMTTKVLAFANGATAGNQLSGVSSVTTPAAPASTNLNGVTAPWTNLAMAA